LTVAIESDSSTMLRALSVYLQSVSINEGYARSGEEEDEEVMKNTGRDLELRIASIRSD
jgi:hypothetical protein